MKYDQLFYSDIEGSPIASDRHPPPFIAFRLLVVTRNRPPAAHAARLDPIRVRPPNDLRSAIRKLKVFGFLLRCFKSVSRTLRRRLGPLGGNEA